MSVELPGQVLKRRFLDPLGMTASQLAQAIHVPRSRISELFSGRRAITADTAARLAVLFGVEPKVFLLLQVAWDLEQLEIPEIEPLDTSGFLVGPQGAWPLDGPQVSLGPQTAKMTPELLARLRAKAAQSPPTGPHELVPVRYANGQQAWESRPKGHGD